MKNKIIILAVVLTVSVLILSHTTLNSNKNHRDGVIRIGIFKHESSLPIYLAYERNYFSKAGVEVELYEVAGCKNTSVLNNDIKIMNQSLLFWEDNLGVFK